MVGEIGIYKELVREISHLCMNGDDVSSYSILELIKDYKEMVGETVWWEEE